MPSPAATCWWGTARSWEGRTWGGCGGQKKELEPFWGPWLWGTGVCCSHTLKLSLSIWHSLNSVRNMQQPSHVVNMQRKWYCAPFKSSVSVPKQFPDTLSIPPNKLPFISVLVRAEQECITWKWFSLSEWRVILPLLHLPGWLDSHKNAWFLWLNLILTYMQASSLSLFDIFLQWKNNKVLASSLSLAIFRMKCSASVFCALLLKTGGKRTLLTGRSAPSKVFYKQYNPMLARSKLLFSSLCESGCVHTCSFWLTGSNLRCCCS